MSGCNRNQVELVGVFVSDSRVYNSSWQWVLESTDITGKESGVDPLARVDVQELGGGTKAKSSKGLLDLVDLSTADTFDLSFSDTISVEDDLCWRGTIGPFEGLTSLGHSIAERVSGFLAYVILDNAGRPIGRCAVVHRAAESKH